jgi:nucleoside-diphosphate-sugar epimerase
MRVLVTGATGFTGNHLARALLAAGREVRVLVRGEAKYDCPVTGVVQVMRGDLRSAKEVEAAVAGVDVVYHVAALYRAAKHADQLYWDVNVGGTQHVLDAARRQGVQRVVHCSTIGVHGGVAEAPANEEAPFDPGDIYQVTKLAGEQLAQAAFAKDIPGVVVRPAGIYGPGDMRFHKLFLLVRQGRFVMFGSGQVNLHMVYVDDLVTGMMQCAESPRALGRTYILGGPEYATLNELVRLVAQAVGAKRSRPLLRLPLSPLMAAATLCEWCCRPLGVEPPLHRRRAAFFTKNRGFTIERARAEIGYEPQVPLAVGLRRTAAWYRSQNLLPA